MLVDGSGLSAGVEPGSLGALWDAQLLDASAEGDADAWALLVARYVGEVWNAVGGRDASDSVAAGATLVAWQRLSERLGRPDVTEGVPVGTWLARTAVHAVRSVTAAAARGTAADVVPRQRVPDRDVRLPLQKAVTGGERADELGRRRDFAERHLPLLAADRRHAFFAALSTAPGSSTVHAVRDVGPLTDRHGLTGCALLTGDEVTLMTRIDWRDVRTVDRCPECVHVHAVSAV